MRIEELIRNTKPEIIVSIQDDYLDHVGDEPLSRYVYLTWQWCDDKGNWASLEVLGAVDGNFDIATLDYSFEDCQARCSDDTLSESELWELQELMVHHACGFNPLHDGCTRKDI